MTQQQYLGQFTHPTAATHDFTVDTDPSTGPFNVTLTAADYYVAGYTGEAPGTLQYVEHIQAQIRAAAGAFATATVLYDAATGLITIDMQVASAIVWVETDIRDNLGFTGNLSGAGPFIATNQARYVWRPTLGLSDYPGDLTRWWGQDSTTISGRASDGTNYGAVGNILKQGDYEYMLLPESEVITDSSTVWESLEQFWADVPHNNMPIRCYPDRTLSASTSFETGFWTGPDGVVGVFHGKAAERWKQRYNGLWNVQLKIHEDPSA